MYFPNLDTLVLDKNALSDLDSCPPLARLSTLWCNNNEVQDLPGFLAAVGSKFPTLQYLSIMKNPSVPDMVGAAGAADGALRRSYSGGLSEGGGGTPVVRGGNRTPGSGSGAGAGTWTWTGVGASPVTGAGPGLYPLSSSGIGASPATSTRDADDLDRDGAITPVKRSHSHSHTPNSHCHTPSRTSAATNHSRNRSASHSQSHGQSHTKSASRRGSGGRTGGSDTLSDWDVADLEALVDSGSGVRRASFLDRFGITVPTVSVTLPSVRVGG